MATLSAEDLTGATGGSIVREDVMEKLWDISNIPLPFTSMIGKDSANNPKKEWVKDSLASPDITNAVVDGADITQNDESVGTKVGNYCQISVKEVMVSDRADKTNSMAGLGKLANQIMRRQKELRRDVDAICLTGQASVAGVADTTAPKSGGLAAWLETATSRGALGADGGYNTGTGVVDAETAGNKQALSEADIKAVLLAIYEAGEGMPTAAICTPAVAQLMSTYYMGASTVAALQADQGRSKAAAAALGAVNVIVSDFDIVLDIVPNRLQQTYTAADTGAVSHVFFVDPSYLSIAYHEGYKVQPLAKTGLTNKRLMSVDWTLVVGNEAACGLVADVNAATAMTA